MFGGLGVYTCVNNFLTLTFLLARGVRMIVNLVMLYKYQLACAQYYVYAMQLCTQLQQCCTY